MSSSIPLGIPRCCFRAGRSMLIPYVTYNLTGISPDLPVKQIIVGPTPHLWLAIQSVGAWLRSNNLYVEVQNSKIPYRSGRL